MVFSGHCHRSIGRAMSKKDATAKAANDFVNFLIAEKLIDASDLPAAIVSFFSLSISIISFSGIFFFDIKSVPTFLPLKNSNLTLFFFSPRKRDDWVIERLSF